MDFTRIGESLHFIIANVIIELGLFSSGTKDYIVSVSNSENGPWTEFKNGTFENPIPNCSSTTQSHNDRNPIFEFDANLVTARYVQFRCLSYYATRCALNFIEVY